MTGQPKKQLKIRKSELDSPNAKRKVFGASRQWPRFSKYKIVKDHRGEEVVIPASGAKLTYYNPMDAWKDVLHAFLVMGKALREKNRTAWKQFREQGEKKRIPQGRFLSKLDPISDVLDFCDKYGLFGLFYRYIIRLNAKANWDTSADYVELNSNLIPPNPVAGQGFLPHAKYFPIFFPRGVPKDFSGHVDESNLRSYGENLSHILYESEAILHDFEEWERFRKLFKEGKSNPKSPVLDESGKPLPGTTYDSYLDNVVRGIGIGQRFTKTDDRWLLTIEFRWPTLIDALALMQLLNRFDEIMPVRQCALSDCDRSFGLFIPDDPRDKYCCDEHAERGKKREQRKKKKEQTTTVSRKAE